MGDVNDNTESVYRSLLDADESAPTQIERNPNQTTGFSETFLSQTSSLIHRELNLSVKQRLDTEKMLLFVDKEQEGDLLYFAKYNIYILDL